MPPTESLTFEGAFVGTALLLGYFAFLFVFATIGYMCGCMSKEEANGCMDAGCTSICVAAATCPFT